MNDHNNTNNINHLMVSPEVLGRLRKVQEDDVLYNNTVEFAVKKGMLKPGDTLKKENIDDERLSPSIDLINKLKKKGSLITKFDPMINKNSMPSFSKYDIVIFCVNYFHLFRYKTQ